MEIPIEDIKEEPGAFKTIRKRNLRQRKDSSGDEDGESGKSNIVDPSEVS